MGSYNVCSRLPMKKMRFQISPADTRDGSIEVIYNEISKHLELKELDFEIIYAGQLLKRDLKTTDYSLQNQSTLYVVPTFSSSKSKQTEAPTARDELFTSLQNALLNHDYKNIVEVMLTDTDTVENIIATTPGLDKDPAVLAMLLKPELLAVLAHPNNLERLMKQHPAFAQAALTVTTAVNEEGAKSGRYPRNSAPMTYSMDQMSDEDDESPGPSRPPPMTGAAGGTGSITASQLAAAIQAATSSTSQSRSQTNQSGPSSSGTNIMNDFFQQAMRQAQMASSDGALQQLRDMGITDESVARQALAATNGDIQAAVDLIFGDGFM